MKNRHHPHSDHGLLAAHRGNPNKLEIFDWSNKYLIMALIAFCLLMVLAASVRASKISIRGHSTPQAIPMASVQNWPVWSYDIDGDLLGSELVPVPDALNGGTYGDGWIAPSTFDELFLPADLPMPQFTPALGICVAQGVPRYVMPSCILSLATPEGEWRNRGLKSLPRAQAWIDAFSPFGSTSIGLLELSVFRIFSTLVILWRRVLSFHFI